MRILIKSQEEKNRLNATMLQSLTDIQRWMNSGHRANNPEGSKSSAIKERGLLVDHLTLKDPLGVQALHLTGVRGLGITKIVHMMNLRRKGLLPLTMR